MSRFRKFTILMLMSVAPATFAIAQTPQPPPSDTEPSSASTPHQRQAMHDQMMKECMMKEHQKSASMSQDQLKKKCKDQLKMQEQPRD